MKRTIINFSTNDQGVGTLSRAVPRVDPSNDGWQQWDIDFVFGVDEVQAEHVAPAVPKATEYLARARDGKGSSTITVKPAQRDVRLSIAPTGDADVDFPLADIAAEVRHIKLAVTEKAQAFTARVRIYGLTPQDGAALLMLLGKPVELTVQPAQMSLDFGDGAPIGAIVTGHDGMQDVFGVLKQKRGDQYIVDDFGVLHTIGSITAAIDMSSDAMPLAERYAVEVRRLGDSPSWRSLVASIGGVGDGVLTSAVVKHAVAMHLPPEAGVGG